MNILLLGTQVTSDKVDDYYARYMEFMQQALHQGGRKAVVQYAVVEDLIISIGDGQFSIFDACNNQPLQTYQFVWIRGQVRQYLEEMKTVSVFLNHHDIPVVNDYSDFRSSSKLVQALQFHEQGLPVAETVLVTPAVLLHPDRLNFDFPCIMKATYGHHGQQNYLVKNLDEVRHNFEQDSDGKYVLQRYVPNTGDYRILIIGPEVSIIKRTAVAKSHLNNTSQGGGGELLPESALPTEVIQQARAICDHLHMTMAGVDVLYDEERKVYSFLEVNAQPQLMSGVFVDEKVKLVGDYFKHL